MPAISTLTINDGQTVPVAHTYSPVSTSGAHAYWADRSPSSPAGYLKIDHNVENPNGKSSMYRISLGTGQPVLGTVDGTSVVVRTSSASVVFNIHPDSTLAERGDLFAYVKNLLANADIKTSVMNIEPFY